MMSTSISIFVVALVLLQQCSSVQKADFKTCDQSSFCRRLRKINPDNSPYELRLETFVADKNSVEGEIFNNDYGVAFVLKVSALVDGTFKLFMNEKQPLHPRYSVEYALKGEPTYDGIKMEKDIAAGVIKLSNTQGHKAILYAKPFKAEFYDAKGGLAAVINDRGLTTMEHMREKPKAPEQKPEQGENENEAEVAAPEEETDPGAWEENFKSHHDTKPRGPEGLSMDVTFPKATHLYGIPEHADSFALRTTSKEDPYRLYNLDVFQYELQSTMALYGAVPVVYAHGLERTVGVFWLNAAETWVDVENSRDSNVVSSIVSFVSRTQKEEKVSARFMSESGVMEVYIFLGPTPTDCFTQYTRLTGTAPLPQHFSLAYHQSRWNYNDEEDVRSVDEGFDKYDIPMDVIWLDIEYTDGKKYFTWDSMKFAHPAEMVANLTAKGRRMVVIIDPHIKRQSGYFLHEYATDNGLYVKNKDGKDYEGWCWPGSSSYLDFYDPKVRDYYSSLYDFKTFHGTSNQVQLWNDMNEPSVFNGPEVTMPKDCMHYGGWEHRHVHNTYGLLHTMSTYKGLLDRSQNTVRPFILSRAHFAGTQRYAAVWTGDNMADWGHLQATIPMCLSLAISGISFCGADVGGFFSYPEAELMTRWYQLGAFQPFFRAHSHIETKRREPWLYDSATMQHIRDAIRRRYSYLPLWYTLFHEHSITGLPVMRPCMMHFPKEPELFAIDTQYMIGDALLVRPVIEEGVTSVNVVLPGDENQLWYDVDTYFPLKPGKITQNVDMTKIPVYQKGGSIVCKKERMRRSSALMAHDPYTLIVALDSQKQSYGSLYIDDGESFEYKQGKYIYAKLAYENNILSYTFPDSSAFYPTKSWLERVVLVGLSGPPKRVELEIVGDKKKEAMTVTYHNGNNVLVVKKPKVSMAQQWKMRFEF